MGSKVSEIVAEIVRSANQLSIKYEAVVQENKELKETLRRERLKNACVEHELTKTVKG